MGRWSQARRRGSSPGAAPLPPAPVLTAGDGYITLDWSWEGADPDHWNIQSSVDGETEWEDSYAPAGADREYVGAAFPFYYRIAGAAADDNLVTGWSNVIQLVGP